jgi:hypothetical protein
MKRRALTLLAALIPVLGAVIAIQPPAQAACVWTQFYQPNPDYMVQVYTNCNPDGGTADRVTPYYVLNGAYHIFNDCATLTPGSSHTWYYESGPVPNAQYGTAFCNDDSWSYTVGHADSTWIWRFKPTLCWTHFDNAYPQGGQMHQYYYNCSPSSTAVMPFYALPNGSIVAIEYPVWLPADTTSQTAYADWTFHATPPVGSFSTAFWAGIVS